MIAPGPDVGPRDAGDRFLSLLRTVPLTRREQRIAIVVLLSPTPLTAWAVAKQTGLAYSHTKAIVRRLVTRKILARASEGLYFQPYPAWCRPPLDTRDHRARGSSLPVIERTGGQSGGEPAEPDPDP